MEATAFNETFIMPTQRGDDLSLAGLLVVLEEMMETAGRHAEILGVGVRDLHAKGLTWVLARLHVRFSAIPAAGEAVHIATWPAGRHRLFAVRDFQLTRRRRRRDPARHQRLGADEHGIRGGRRASTPICRSSAAIPGA